MIPLKLTVLELSEQTNISVSQIIKILNGELAISPALASRLGEYFENAPQYWIDLQKDYDEDQQTWKISREQKPFFLILSFLPGVLFVLMAFRLIPFDISMDDLLLLGNIISLVGCAGFVGATITSKNSKRRKATTIILYLIFFVIQIVIIGFLIIMAAASMLFF